MSRALAFLACALLAAAAHAADDAPLARVLSTSAGATPTRVTVKIKVERGAFYEHDSVELLAPAGKVAATLTLPAPISMLMKGDEIAVTLDLAKPLAAPGFIAGVGGYANLAAAQASLGAAKAPAAPAAAATALPAHDPCPYAPAELGAAFEMKFDKGKGYEMPFPGGKQLSCSYTQTGDHFTVFVVQLVMTPAEQQRSTAEWERRLAGQLAPLAGDKDGAKWQLDPYDAMSVALHYLRGAVRVTVRAHGGSLKAPALQPRLLTLRRIP